MKRFFSSCGYTRKYHRPLDDRGFGALSGSMSLALRKSPNSQKTTIDDLIDYLMSEHKLTFFEARGIILKYTHDLMQRGLIAVAGE